MNTPFYFISKPRKEFLKNMTHLKQEKKGLEHDVGSVKEAVRGASKLENQEEPSDLERTSLEHLKQNYPAFFDSDEDSETDEEQDNKKGKGKEKAKEERSQLSKLMELKTYIRNELKFNSRNIFDLKKNERARLIEQDQLYKASSSKNEEESTSKPLVETEESTSKPSVETEESTSKPSSSSDDLSSSTYNPFDDIGFD